MRAGTSKENSRSSRQPFSLDPKPGEIAQERIDHSLDVAWIVSMNTVHEVEHSSIRKPNKNHHTSLINVYTLSRQGQPPHRSMRPWSLCDHPQNCSTRGNHSRVAHCCCVSRKQTTEEGHHWQMCRQFQICFAAASSVTTARDVEVLVLRVSDSRDFVLGREDSAE